jgi:peptide methionine sulfoxide reductase msrA/msrB
MKTLRLGLPCVLTLWGLFMLVGCDRTSAHEPAAASPQAVTVRLMGADGRLAEPVQQAPLQLSPGQWKQRLGESAYRVLREEGTESPGSSALLHNKQAGVYVCAGCSLPLFASSAKFDSGTGWPSFFEPIARQNITDVVDNSHGMVRTENQCTRCGGHLGHVFDDGPPPTGLRYCMNGLALRFVPQDQLGTLVESAPATQPATQPAASAAPQTLVLAGGCFWCTEAVFELVPGVTEVMSGYAGGTAETANYKAVCTGATDHAEVIRVTFDPARVSVRELLHTFFLYAHDPTQLNRQGPDEGRQYRSAVFYADAQQEAEAQAVIQELTEQKKFSRPIVTTLEPLKGFYPAEKYHQDYARLNPVDPYIRAVAAPKVEKFKAGQAKP